MMPALSLIDKYYSAQPQAHGILLRHSEAVARMAVGIARQLGDQVDVAFVEEAAWLHDIGIFSTHAPQIGCNGPLPYICHGVEGRKLLDAEDLPRHALVCERHIGVGLAAADIRSQRLSLPERDMLPLTLEEQIITYADLFFSKKPHKEGQAKTVEQVRKSLERHGAEKIAVFDRWHERFAGSALKD